MWEVLETMLLLAAILAATWVGFHLGASREREKSEQKCYAAVSWSVEDILSLDVGFNERQAHDFLASNERHVQDIMVSRGWEAIEDLIALGDPRGGA